LTGTRVVDVVVVVVGVTCVVVVIVFMVVQTARVRDLYALASVFKFQ